MKPGIIIVALAAMTLAVVGMQDSPAQAEDPSVRFAGSNFITSSQDDGTPTPAGEASTSMQSGIAKGKFGKAVFSAQTVIEEALPDGRCPPQLPVGNDLSTTIVMTYNDGSILSIATGPGSFYCSDGTVFAVDFTGIVTGGEGRFEGATGTWEGTARAESARVTADARIDLD